MSVKSKFIILLLLLILFPFLSWSQGSCTFSIQTTVTPVDCRANGVIAISLEGSDLSSMQDFMYRAYPSNANPNDYDFITNHIISGLEEGEYNVEVKAFCTLNGVNISQIQTKVNVPRTHPYIEPDFTVNPNAGRKSLNCLPSGMIQLQSIVKGKGPYTLKLTSYPASYTGNPVILDNVTSLNSTYQISNLPAGTYEIELSDGCGSAIKRTAVVEALTSDFYSSLIYTSFYYDPRVQNDNCSSLTFYKYNGASSGDWYYYNNNASLFYEYAIYYSGDDISSLEWKPLGNSSTYTTFETRYTLNEMRSDTNKRAKIYVRVKGGNCDPNLYSPTMPATITVNRTTIDCDIQELSFNVGSTGINSSAIICFPYTWTITETTSEGVSTTTSPSGPRNSGHTDKIRMTPGSGYVITVTDAQGYSFQSAKWTSTAISPSFQIYGSYKTSCNDSVAIYLSGASLRGGTIEFLEATSGINIPHPIHKKLSIPKTYTGSIYPYSTAYNLSSYIATNKIPTGEKIQFLVTDSCGRERTLTYTGVSTYFFENNPTINTTTSCGRATITAPNLADVYKSLNTSTNAVTKGSTVYLKIMSAPTGADVIYSFGSGYIRSTSATDNIQVSKSGTYRLRVSTSTSFTTSSCYLDMDVDIQIPEMSIDEATTAAYRCPGSLVGTGYMNIKVKNGSGNYHFTLYGQNDPNTVLATSTDGVFTSWQPSSSDYYSVKIEDLNCGRSMTHSIFVYDLGNATLGWPEDNIFIKCLGDKIRLYSLALGETSYTWTGPGGWSSTERNPEIPIAELGHSGVYTITVEVPGCGAQATVSHSFRLSIADKVMYWNPDAVDNNWYNIANWLTSTSEQALAVPAPCTTVHIAGNALKYPNLSMETTPRSQYGFPACDTIIYHYGSETVYPHFLKYNRARVQYNLGFYQTYATNTQPTLSNDYSEYPDAFYGDEIPSIKRAQWYLISAPLKHITGGDFGLAGYPNLYQRLYNSTDPERGEAAKDSYTLPFNTQNIDLTTTGHAMALWVPDYDPAYIGLGDHKYLQALKGILEMPYFLNPQIMAQRPLNTYNVADSTSIFQYYDAMSPTLNPVNQRDSYQRGYQAYRFAFENAKDTVSIYNVKGQNVAGYRLILPEITTNSQSKRVLIGNPLMCHIDFDKIYALNSDVIEDYYMISDGAGELFKTYRVEGVANDLPKQIPPLQGFIVTLKSSGTNSLLLPFEGANSIISPTADGSALPKPRITKSANANSSRGWLNIVASTPPKSGLMGTLGNVSTRSTLLINYPISDIPKVVFPDGLDKKAEVYLIGGDGYLNTEQVEYNHPETVKFGVESQYKENITLSFEKDNGVIDRVILVDKYLNTTKDITDDKAYTFKHRSTYNKGIDNDRFELYITYNSSSIDKTDNGATIIQLSKTKLEVESDNIINSVSLYDTAGRCILTKLGITTTHFSEDVNLSVGVYAVAVTLTNDKRIITKKVAVK